MSVLRALTASLVLVAACSSSAADTPCAPACRPGETCTLGVCLAQCNPACGAGQQCVLVGNATSCVSLDASRADVAADMAPLDAPDDLAPPDIVQPDAPTDVSFDKPEQGEGVDAPLDLPPEAAPLDAAPDVAMDAVAEAAVDVTPEAAMDVPPDRAMEAAVEAAVDAPADVAADDGPPPLPPCGMAGQPCCGPRGSDVACRAGLLCNAFENGRCEAPASRSPGECTSTTGIGGALGCGSGLVCAGATTCGSRWCYRCTVAGRNAYDTACDATMQGRDCATGVCAAGRCTWACEPGAAGDAECERRATGSRCVVSIYGYNLTDAGLPTSWVTPGICLRGCQRNADCTMGRFCVAAPNILDDRIDYVCSTNTRAPAGTTCSRSTDCQSGLCISVPGTGARCTTPCITDADCPTGAPACSALTLLRPVSGYDQPTRGCLPR